MNVLIRDLAKKLVFGARVLRRPCAAYCANNSLCPDVLVRTPAAKLRELLLLPESSHKTQLNQDVFALLVNRFRRGFFMEIGANDGFTLSNTIYLEEQFGWNGLLVEANPEYENTLNKRNAKSVMAAVTKKAGFFDFCSAGLYGGLVEHLKGTHENKTKHGDLITVWGATLEEILTDYDAPERINFVSIDVEGAELPIVEQLVELKNHRFVCGCIEHNARRADYQRMSRLLEAAEYRVVWHGQTQHDLFFVDGKV